MFPLSIGEKKLVKFRILSKEREQEGHDIKSFEIIING